MKPDEVDFLTDVCPVGTTIVIEGEGKIVVQKQMRNIFFQIAQARAIINKRSDVVNGELLRRISIVEIDAANKILKVRVAPVPFYLR